MCEKKVSVVMATYNGERFLDKQLASICNQTHKNMEIIVLDDCSTDGTVDILRAYHERHGIHYQVNPVNLGYRKNFENALSFAQGDYIAFADQDDIWMPDKIETMIAEIGPYSMIYSDATLIDGEDQVIHQSLSRYTKTGALPEEAHHYKKVVFYWLTLGCTMLFKRELLEELIPFADDGTAHDRQLSILAARKNKIKRIARPLMQYRLHGNNTFGVAKGTFMREFSPRFLFPLEKEIQRIQYYLDTNNYSCPEDRSFLLDLRKYYDAKMQKSVSLTSLWIAFRYRHIFYRDFTPLERLLSVVGHILMFDKLYRYLYQH